MVHLPQAIVIMTGKVSDAAWFERMRYREDRSLVSSQLSGIQCDGYVPLYGTRDHIIVAARINTYDVTKYRSMGLLRTGVDDSDEVVNIFRCGRLRVLYYHMDAI